MSSAPLVRRRGTETNALFAVFRFHFATSVRVGLRAASLQLIVLAGEVLLEVELWDLRKRSLRQLSKGQRRRALLAAAWIGRPQTLVLDEPLDTMDRGIRVKISEWLGRVCQSGGLALVATHEIEPFAGLTSRAIAVAQGRLQVFEPLPVILQDRLTLLERLGRSDF